MRPTGLVNLTEDGHHFALLFVPDGIIHDFVTNGKDDGVDKTSTVDENILCASFSNEAEASLLVPFVNFSEHRHIDWWLLFTFTVFT